MIDIWSRKIIIIEKSNKNSNTVQASYPSLQLDSSVSLNRTQLSGLSNQYGFYKSPLYLILFHVLGLLYKAPELLRCTSLRELNVRDLQKGDVYSFAIVLYELQGRHGPFGITDLSTDEILKRVKNPDYEISPFR